MEQQNFKNHAKFVPLFHFFSAPVLIMNFVWCCVRLWKSHFAIEGFLGVVVAAGLLGMLLSGRLAALAVQDRVIRLEERLRYAELFPEDLKARIGDFTIAQIVSLRFASDAELPALARKVLSENLQDRKAIKQLIQNWKADYARA
ncbi:MAG TPA: DUF6526 family protein [Candidatus Dormibacteraeota bacterium]|nr:DUF6526 family protein [Candidatus Dormibacteraeota bacterium]